MKGVRRTTLIALCTLAMSSQAATLIESRNDEGQPSQMWIEKDKVRVEQTELEGFMLLDLKTGEVYAVDDTRKQAIEIDWGEDSVQDAAQSVDASLQELGAGPEIAGYSTQRYRLTADGEDCGEYFMSKQLLNNNDVRRMIDAFEKFKTDIDEIDDICDVADQYIATQLPKVGIPLRHENADGVQHEIVRIEENVQAPGGFSIPSDYQRVSMQELMQQMMQQQQQNMGR